MLRKCATPFVLCIGLVVGVASTGGSAEKGSPESGGGPFASACDELVASTCGQLDECAGMQACTAAGQLRQDDLTGEECQAALNDTTTYIPCTPVTPPSKCEELVDLVCGKASAIDGARPCADDFACINALLLATTDGGTGDASAHEDRCQTAQRETALFPHCPR